MRMPMVVLMSGCVLVCAVAMTGCGKGRPAGTAGGDAATSDAHAHHDHGEEGPHGGHIIELGSEQHHAELTHVEDGHRVGVYILGPDAKTPTPIDAKSVTITVRAGGEPTPYELPAAPQPGEPEGQSSYFEIESEPLHAVVSGEAAATKPVARLSINIGGNPYVGLIDTSEHHHDHDHGHAH